MLSITIYGSVRKEKIDKLLEVADRGTSMIDALRLADDVLGAVSSRRSQPIRIIAGEMDGSENGAFGSPSLAMIGAR